MRNMRAAAIVIGLLTTVPALGFAAPGGPQPTDTTAKASTTQGTLHATKGIVRFVDAHKLVIMRSPQTGREMTFVLNPFTEHLGHVKVGSTVAIRYRTEANQQVATAVTVVPAAQPASAPTSHQ
jgi:hypothetical protein